MLCAIVHFGVPRAFCYSHGQTEPHQNSLQLTREHDFDFTFLVRLELRIHTSQNQPTVQGKQTGVLLKQTKNKIQILY